jgi:hypothetical protein
MIAVRVVVGLLGLAAAAYGAVELLDLGLDNLRATVTWLAAGVVLHDAVLAPLVLGIWFVASRARRGRIPGAVVVGAVVLGTVSLVAIPLLGRFGARSDNQTLLDRNYLLGWLVLATLTVATVGVAVALSRTRVTRTGEGGDDGAGAGRR